MIKTLSCFKCGQKLTSAAFPETYSDIQINQPSGGLAFSTEGHYGSTVFDPMNGGRLEINICDPCLGIGLDASPGLTYYYPPSSRQGVPTTWELIGGRPASLDRKAKPETLYYVVKGPHGYSEGTGYATVWYRRDAYKFRDEGQRPAEGYGALAWAKQHAQAMAEEHEGKWKVVRVVRKGT